MSTMTIHDEEQGSSEWLALRANSYTASEAPAMMSASKYQTRTDLLKLKKTGIAPDVGQAQQRIFDKGHATEAMARPILELRTGDLYPIVASIEAPGLAKRLLASMDGATMAIDVLFEHKLLNQDLVAAIAVGELDPHYYWQLEQQLLVSGAKEVVFVCSDGTEENWHELVYTPVKGRAEQLIAGWQQFEDDLADFELTERKPQAVASSIESLPALIVQVKGEVTQSNLQPYKEKVLSFIRSINTDLTTDQHFADAEGAAKFCGNAEKSLDEVKKNALAQTNSIDELFKAVDEMKVELRNKRLELEKLVKSRKEAVRIEIKLKADQEFQAYVAELNVALGGRVTIQVGQPDFVGAMKLKRTIAGIEDAISSLMAEAKIEAKAQAELIGTNLASLRELANEHIGLFRDAQQLVMRPNEEVVSVINSRIIEFKAAEETRLEDERNRIREEERIKAEAKAAADSALLAAQAKKEEDDKKAEAERASKALEASQAIKPDVVTVTEAATQAVKAVTTPAKADNSMSDILGAPAQPIARGGATKVRPDPVLTRPETVTLSREQYDELLQDQALLRALEAAGVDNWDGWNVALETLRKQAA